MIITQDQIASLHSPDKVRGRVAGVVMFSISVSLLTFARACELSVIDAIPVELTWYAVGSTTGRVELHTNQPEFFVELEQRIEDARRQR